MTDLKHFLDLSDMDSATLAQMLADARQRKEGRRGLPKGTPDPDAPLKGRVLAMIFERPSTRTRVSFDVGMRQLGGQTIVLGADDLQLGRGETIADTARVLSRYVDAIMIRTDSHEKLHELAANSSVPVINGLTNETHPCQLMADVMTFEESKGPIRGKTVAFFGDANNNVAASFVHAASKFGFDLKFACPAALSPDQDVMAWAAREGARVTVTENADDALKGADCVVTDTWVSMGDADGESRHNVLQPYQVDDVKMSKANQGAIFMHCLPAHRGEEMTAEVIEGPQSVVFDEAENRMHVQKAILVWCLS